MIFDVTINLGSLKTQPFFFMVFQIDLTNKLCYFLWSVIKIGDYIKMYSSSEKDIDFWNLSQFYKSIVTHSI